MKRNNKHVLRGFTLVELVVVIAVFGLLIAATLSFIAPTSKIFKSASDYSASSGMVDNVRRVVEDNLRYANRMEVFAGSADALADEEAFRQTAVNNLRAKYYIGTTAADNDERVTYSRDVVYVMKINNPETFNNISQSNDRPGKISIWEYDNGTLNAANSKEWAVSEAVFRDYSFSLSYGITYTTDPIVIAGREYDQITGGVYEDFNGTNRFVDPTHFSLVLDIYENNFIDRANRDTSNYNLCRTSASNVIALSFVNLTEGNNIRKETIDCIDHRVTSATAHVSYDPDRYHYTSGNASSDLFFVYTLPDMN